MPNNDTLDTAANATLLAGGTGAVALNRTAKHLFDVTGNPALKKVLPTISSTSRDLYNIQNLAPRNRALAYADLANKLSTIQLPVSFRSDVKLPDGYTLPVTDGKMKAGHWILNAQYKLKDFANDNFLVNMIDLIPGVGLKDKLSSRYRHYVDQIGQMGASYQHYDNFAKSPGHAWNQMINELPDDTRVVRLFMPDDSITLDEFKNLSDDAKQMYADKFPGSVARFKNKIAVAPNGALLSAAEIAKRGIIPDDTLSFQDIVSELMARRDSKSRNLFMQNLSQLQLPASDYDWSDYLDRIKSYTGISDADLDNVGKSAIDKLRATGVNSTVELENARRNAVKGFAADRLRAVLNADGKKHGVSLQEHLSGSLKNYIAENFLTEFADELEKNPELAKAYGGVDKYKRIVNGKQNKLATDNFLDLLHKDKGLFDRYLGKMTVPMLDAASLGPEADFARVLSGLRMKGAYKGYGTVAPVVKAISTIKHPLVLGLGGAAALLGGYNLFSSADSEKFNPYNFDSGLFKKSSTEDTPSSGISLLEALAGAGLTYGGYNNANAMLNELGWSKLNPLGKSRVLVLGGTKTDLLDPVTRKPTGDFKLQTNSSFNAQRAAAAEHLRKSDLLNVTEAPLYYEPTSTTFDKVVDGNTKKFNTLTDTYKPLDLNLENIAKDYDAVYQLGAHPEAYKLGALAGKGDIVRYRQLTDFGAGNFRQPEIWVGGTNWMGVLDDPAGHTRFVVPGNEGMMGDSPTGKKKNLYIDNIAVDEDFYGKTRYADTKGDFFVPVNDAEVKIKDIDSKDIELKPGEFIRDDNGKLSLWRENAVPDGHIVKKDIKGIKRIFAPGGGGHWMTMGGGVGSFLPLGDLAARAGDKEFYRKDLRGIIDDWAEAITGNKATAADRMHILLGGAGSLDTPATKYYNFIRQMIADSQAMSEGDFLAKYSKDMPEALVRSRFKNLKNMKIWDSTRGMADIYQNAKSVTMLPGSTGAEAMRMAGDKLPRFINMIPDERIPWMVKHWSTNADVYGKHLGSKNIGVNTPSADRIEQFKAFLGDGSPVNRPVGNNGVSVDMTHIANQLHKDVRLNKLKNLAKFTGKAGIAALGAGLLGHGLFNLGKSVGDSI